MENTSAYWQQLYPWLLLHLLPGLGPRRTRQLLDNAVYPEQLMNGEYRNLGVQLPPTTLAALQSWESRSGAFWLYQQEETDKIRRWLEAGSRVVLSLEDPRYPGLLKEIADPPLLLYLEGAAEVLNELQVAVVGSRRPTHQGAEIALEFAYQLALSGLTVTSGLAMGVDTQAHLGALRANTATVAVLGCGLHHIYPAQNRTLAMDIVAEGGVLVSEFPLDMPPRAGNFPRRNRIISGLSTGVLVVEAALKSGSLVTARLAAEQGREVFAVPGSIRSQLSKGCHHLIGQGAQLVDGIEPILMTLAPQFLKLMAEPLTQNSQKQEHRYSMTEQQVLELMGQDVCCLDLLVVRSSKPVAELVGALQALELGGAICRVPGGYQRSGGGRE